MLMALFRFPDIKTNPYTMFPKNEIIDGVLLENNDGHLFVQARGIIDSPDIEIMQEMPFESSGIVPVSVVIFVSRAQTPGCVLHDAFHDTQYASDPNILKNQTRSLLCIPLLHQKIFSEYCILRTTLQQMSLHQAVLKS